ncbi:MAG: AI-2E family transporter [Chloroflexi bacterium]|nr:AI-2E family transporter [Chloroflexota bacterium]
MEQHLGLRWLIVLLAAGVALYLGQTLWQAGIYFADIILVFFLSWLVAFVLSPVSRFLMRHSLPPLAAVSAVYLGLILLLVAVGFLILPLTVSQLQQLGGNLPTYVERMPMFVSQSQDELRARGIPIDLVAIYNQQDLLRRAENLGAIIAQNALFLAQSAALTAFNTVLVLVLSFYIMLDGDRIIDRVVSLLPLRYQDGARLLRANVERTFGGYIRGSLLLGLIYGAGTALVMFHQGLGFVLPVSAFAGAMMFIPFFGSILAMVPPLFIALFTGSLNKVVIVFVVLLIWQQIILHLVSPRVLGHQLGIHPLLVLFSLLVGAKLAGFWGVLFGVPVAAAAYSMVIPFLQRTSENREEPSAGGGAP